MLGPKRLCYLGPHRPASTKPIASFKINENGFDKPSIWEQKWKMAIHPDKYNALSITQNKTPVKHTYTLHGHQLELEVSGSHNTVRP